MSVSVTSRFSTRTVLFSVRPPPSFEQVLVCLTHHSRKPPHGLADSATSLCCLPFVKASISSNRLWAEPIPWLCFRSFFPLSTGALWFVWVHRGVLATLAHVQLFMTGHWLFLFVSFSFLFIIRKMVYTKTRWYCCRHAKVCLHMNPHLFLAMIQPLDTVCFTHFSSSGFLSAAA